MKNGATTKFMIKDSVTGNTSEVIGLLNSLDRAEELWIETNNPQQIIDTATGDLVFTVEAG